MSHLFWVPALVIGFLACVGILAFVVGDIAAESARRHDAEDEW